MATSRKQKDSQQLARSKPPKKPAPNKAKPARPAKKQDVQDIDRADSEGMAQPQGLPPKKKNPAAKRRTS